MEINNQECKIINVRTNQGNIVQFYCPMDWQANDVTGIVCREQFKGEQTANYTGFVVWGNVKFSVCGTTDVSGMTAFYLMPDKAERHYDSITQYVVDKQVAK